MGVAAVPAILAMALLDALAVSEATPSCAATYIRLTRTVADAVVSAAEIEVYSGGVNVALQADVSAPATDGFSEGQPPFVNDGDPDTYHHTTSIHADHLGGAAPEIVLALPSCTAVESVTLRMRKDGTWYRGDGLLLELLDANDGAAKSISPPTITPEMGYSWSTTTSCDDSCTPTPTTGTSSMAALPLSQSAVDDGLLIVNYYTGEARPSMVTFSNGKMETNDMYMAWGFTVGAWAQAGITDLNGADWTMKFDFIFPSATAGNWNEYFYIMFNRDYSQVGQGCEICFPLGHQGTPTNHGFVIDERIISDDASSDRSAIRHYDVPFSWLISRSASTGRLTVKLYRRDTDSTVIEVVTNAQSFSDTATKVPIAFYLNSMKATWEGVQVVGTTMTATATTTTASATTTASTGTVTGTTVTTATIVSPMAPALIVSSGTTVLNTDDYPSGFQYSTLEVAAGASIEAIGSQPLRIFATNVVIAGKIDVSGGRGGNAGNDAPGAGGGAGGGALMITASTITVTGSIHADGGDGGDAGGPEQGSFPGHSGGTYGDGSGGVGRAGGFDGGAGALDHRAGNAGSGPGASQGGAFDGGVPPGPGGAGYANPGTNGFAQYTGNIQAGGPSYGDAQLSTGLLGGSGGGGGGNDDDNEEGAGGGGSGGTIHLRATHIQISGVVSALGGLGGLDDYNYNGGDRLCCDNGGPGSVGRIRLDFTTLSGSTNPEPGYTEDYQYQAITITITTSTATSITATSVTVTTTTAPTTEPPTPAPTPAPTQGLPVDTFCHDAIPPCVDGMELIGAGIDVSQLDPHRTATHARRDQAVRLTMEASVPIDIEGRKFVRAPEIIYNRLEEEASRDTWSRATSDRAFSLALAAEIQLEGNTPAKAVGASSSYAASLRTDLQQSIERMSVISVVRKATIKLQSVQARMGQHMRTWLDATDIDGIADNFVNLFGTHFVASVTLGGKVATTITMQECASRHHQTHDLQVAATATVRGGVKSGSASAQTSLTTEQTNAAAKMSFEFVRFGGASQFVDRRSFNYSEWQRSITSENMAIVEIIPQSYSVLLSSESLPADKRAAVMSAIEKKLQDAGDREPVELVSASDCPAPVEWLSGTVVFASAAWAPFLGTIVAMLLG